MTNSNSQNPTDKSIRLRWRDSLSDHPEFIDSDGQHVDIGVAIDRGFTVSVDDAPRVATLLIRCAQAEEEFSK